MAPHTVSPTSSKNVMGCTRPSGKVQTSSRKLSGSASSASGTYSTASTSCGLAWVSGRPGSTPTNGAMYDPLDTVARWSSSPTISTAVGSSPISSSASRHAPSTGASPGSTRPPGKLTSPRWVRRPQVRRVSTTQARPSSSSYSGTSTAEGRPLRAGPSISSRSDGRGGPSEDRAARTAATDGRRRSGGRPAHGAGLPGRAL